MTLKADVSKTASLTDITLADACASSNSKESSNTSLHQIAAPHGIHPEQAAPALVQLTVPPATSSQSHAPVPLLQRWPQHQLGPAIGAVPVRRWC